MFTKTVTAFVLVFGLSACSDSDDSPADAKPSSGPSSPSSGATTVPTKPACADIWKNGAVLPKDYKDCEKPGAQQESVKCKDGTALIVFDDTYFANTGGKITKSSVSPLQDTDAYGSAYSACTGE